MPLTRGGGTRVRGWWLRQRQLGGFRAHGASGYPGPAGRLGLAVGTIFVQSLIAGVVITTAFGARRSAHERRFELAVPASVVRVLDRQTRRRKVPIVATAIAYDAPYTIDR